MDVNRAMVVSSFTVIKGEQLHATYRAFAHWDLCASKKSNLDRLKAHDPIGTRTANWWRDFAWTINRRFDTDGRDRIIVELAQAGVSMDIWRPLVLWHMTRDEFLVRDFLTHWLYVQYTAGTWRVSVADVVPYLDALHCRDGVEIKDVWSPTTTERVASGLLRLAVEFGLMAGKTSREFIPYHLPDEAFFYLLHAATGADPNPHRMIHAEDWRMYLMSPDDVQRELFRLHQHGKLHYEVAGSVAELRLPYGSAAAYARQELIR